MSYFSNSAGIFLAPSLVEGFRFNIWPDNIEDQKSVNWTMVPVIGRAEPIPVYHSSSERRIRLSLMFSASIDASDDGDPYKNVIANLNFLKSLLYPNKVKNSYFTNPPLAFLIIGKTIASTVIMNSLSVGYSGPWNKVVENYSDYDYEFSGDILATGGDVLESLIDYPMLANANIEFTVVNSSMPSSAGVRSKGEDVNELVAKANERFNANTALNNTNNLIY